VPTRGMAPVGSVSAHRPASLACAVESRQSRPVAEIPSIDWRSVSDDWDALWLDLHLATLDEGVGSGAYGEIGDGAIATRRGRIAWIGRRKDLLADSVRRCPLVHSGGGRWLTPGLVECHTHLVFGGNRADEFERRLKGETYASISRAGGGIQSTVRATREASDEALLGAARRRVRDLAAEGVTTVEIKSGYGLDPEMELRMLRLARRLGSEVPIDVRTTFLGLHALPDEWGDRRTDYLDLITEETLPQVVDEGLADQVDAFLETIAFSTSECERFLRAGLDRGLGARLHADQLADGGGAGLAARVGASSADHLEHASPDGVRAMGEAGTVAVLLPGAFLGTGETARPPVAEFRQQGVDMAVSTDLNPGTSPLCSLRAVLHLSCVLFGLTPAEALRGATVCAARALGLRDRGVLAAGLRADFAVWDVGHPRELSYWLGGGAPPTVVVQGESLSFPW
jgi:imidazolonepropionase